MFSGGNPAFPIETPREVFSGLTARELFAAMALQGSIAAAGPVLPSKMSFKEAQDHARAALLCADALILELDKS